MLAVPGHSSIFLVLALPACLAAACILLHRMNQRNAAQSGRTAGDVALPNAAHHR